MCCSSASPAGVWCAAGSWRPASACSERGRASEGCGADFAEGDSLGHLSVSTQLEN